MTDNKQYPELHQIIRDAGGIVHSDGNIFFTNAEMFKRAAQQPAQKEPLTDEQIDDLVATASITERNLFRRFARAVEAAHGITAHKEQR